MSSKQDGNRLGLEWLSDDRFRTKNFTFKCSTDDFSIETTDETVAFLKGYSMISLYEEYLPETVDRVFELGFFHGGMPLLLADALQTQKVVAIDYALPSDALKRHVERADMTRRVKFYGRTMQDDVVSLRNILDSEFGNSPHDLITDDCSHEYAQTKASFEGTFGYLRPGGQFIIEDWGWAHWPSGDWQTDESYFNGRPALTNLLFEILMTHATAPGIISRIEVPSPAFAVITRGPDLKHKEHLSLDGTYKTAGRNFVVL